MAVISLVARLGAQTAEFEKSFAKASTTAAQFEKQYGTMASSLAAHQARINAAFASFSGDKIIREANELATAIGRVGGASKLTASEQASANRTITEAIAKYEALGHAAPQSLRDIAAATKQQVGHFDSLISQVKAMTLGMIGAQAVIGGVSSVFHAFTAFIGSSIQSYASAEAAQKKLTAALVSQGQATPAIIAQYDKLATQFQRTTVFSDDLTSEMEGLLVQVGQVMPAQMEGALKASTDLSAGLGIDLRASTLLVAKAFSGGGDELGRLKAILGDAYVAGQGMDGILKAINAKFGGQAQAEIETYAGKIKQLGNEWDNVKEAVGKAVVDDPIVIASLRALADNTAKAGDAAAKAAPTIIEYWAALAGVGSTTGTLIKFTEALVSFYNTVGHPPPAPDLSKLTPTRPLQFGQNLPSMDALLDDAKKMLAAQDKAAEAAKRHAEALKELNARFADAERALVPLNDAQARLIIHYTNLKLSVADIAAKMHIGTREVQQYTDGVQAMNRVAAESIPLINHMKESLAHSADGMIPTISLMKRAWPEAISGLDQFSTMTKSELAVFTKAFADLGKEVPHTTDSIGALSQAFAEMAQIGGDSFGGIVRSIGQAVAAINTLNKATAAIGGGGSSGSSESSTSKITGALSAYIGIGVAAYQAGKAIYKAMNDGRKSIEDFAASFGGFDSLRQQMLVLGDAGEEMWRQLTQQTGRGDKRSAEIIEQRIRDAIAASPATLAGNAGFKTRDELIAIEKQAKSTYDFMLESGKYTASELARAFEAYTTAQTAAMDDTGAAVSAASEKIKALSDEFDGLAKSVSAEAPEEVMGVIEEQQRARMAAIEQEKTAIQLQADEELKARTETQKQIESETKDSHQRIQDYFNSNELEVLYHFKATNGLPGSEGLNVPALAKGGIVRRPTLALVGEKGPEAVVPLSQLGRSGGGQPMLVQLLMPNGQVLLEQMVKAGKREAVW